MTTESEYHKLFNSLGLTTLESAGFPTNYNLLTQQQLDFFRETVDVCIDRYSESYVELLQTFQEDLKTLSNQTQEIIDEVTK